jgi:hypothetical protein
MIDVGVKPIHVGLTAALWHHIESSCPCVRYQKGVAPLVLVLSIDTAQQLSQHIGGELAWHFRGLS